MASSKVISTTWTKKDLVAKLKQNLKRMDDEVDAWEKANATIEKRQAAWDKKALAWGLKNISKARDTDASEYHNRVQLNISFDLELIKDAVGERPSQDRKPQYKNSSYNEKSEYELLENALSLVEGSVDLEYKITSSSTWASFIR
jgi:hypothetical protein